MEDNATFDYESFISANAGKTLTGFDYLHAIYKSEGLTSDFIVFFSKLFWPDFKSVDGLIFISEIFDLDRYQGLLKGGQSKNEAQFWINLLEISGLFDELPLEEAKKVAQAIAASWNAKLEAEFSNLNIPARVINDDETGEVFVTIGEIVHSY